jgi:hypothetical protein
MINKLISHNKNNNSPTSHQTSKHQKTKTEAVIPRFNYDYFMGLFEFVIGE